ncbi:MAG TPA: ABC transporter permease, partial [Actinomycetota bacterium]|nr:ABC transporter permease [Actinomycetota bacterium]
MRAALLISAKDLRQRLRDRSALLVAIVVPFSLAYIFSLILTGVTGGSTTFTFAVVDRDGGPVASAFTDRVLRGLERDGLIEVRTEDSMERAGALA